MKTQRLTFANADNHQLSARLELPDTGEQPVAYALFAHCFTCTKNLRAITNIARALTEEGFGVLRFDFTGLGDSEGDFSDTNFSTNISDLIAAANFLERDYAAPQILIGHSLGGAAAIQAAHRLPSVRAVATIGSPYDPSHITHLLEKKRREIETVGEAEVEVGGRPFTFKKQFLDDLKGKSAENLVRTLKRALLIFHSPIDNVVGIENAREMFTTARHPKSFISLDDADHLLSDSSDSEYVGTVIAAWAHKYLDQEEETPNTVVVRTGTSHYHTQVLADGHTLIVDEPTDIGGTDQGPTPYDLLLASLGSCTSITLRMYADRKKWPLESITVSLTHGKIHAEDCEECDTEETGQIDHIDRQIELAGPLNDEQRSRLLEIADRCPVHRTLHNTIVVNTHLKG